MIGWAPGSTLRYSRPVVLGYALAVTGSIVGAAAVTAGFGLEVLAVLVGSIAFAWFATRHGPLLASPGALLVALVVRRSVLPSASTVGLAAALTVALFVLARARSSSPRPIHPAFLATSTMMVAAIAWSTVASEDLGRAAASGLVFVLVLFVFAYWAQHRWLAAEAIERDVTIVAGVLAAVVASCILVEVGGFGESFVQDRWNGWLAHPNRLGATAAALFTLAVAQVFTRRAPALALAAISSFALVMSGSRTSLLAAFVGGAVSVWVQRPSRFGALTVVVGLALVVGDPGRSGILSFLPERLFEAPGETRSFAQRQAIWEEGLAHVADQPILGHGLGSSPALRAASDNIFIIDQAQSFHNGLLQVLVETGLVGGIALLVLVGATLIRRPYFGIAVGRSSAYGLVVTSVIINVGEALAYPHVDPNGFLLWFGALALLQLVRLEDATTARPPSPEGRARTVGPGASVVAP